VFTEADKFQTLTSLEHHINTHMQTPNFPEDTQEENAYQI
jgi:hypothetical protein